MPRNHGTMSFADSALALGVLLGSLAGPRLIRAPVKDVDDNSEGVVEMLIVAMAEGDTEVPSAEGAARSRPSTAASSW